MCCGRHEEHAFFKDAGETEMAAYESHASFGKNWFFIWIHPSTILNSSSFAQTQKDLAPLSPI